MSDFRFSIFWISKTENRISAITLVLVINISFRIITSSLCFVYSLHLWKLFLTSAYTLWLNPLSFHSIQRHLRWFLLVMFRNHIPIFLLIVQASFYFQNSHWFLSGSLLGSSNYTESMQDINKTTKLIQLGEIMNLGVYFGGVYEKSSVVFPSLSTSSKEKLDLYLEFHFVVKTKVVENCVSFLSVIY